MVIIASQEISGIPLDYLPEAG